MEAICNFFLSWLFSPFILLLVFYLIVSFTRFCNLEKLQFWGARVLRTSSNHWRQSDQEEVERATRDHRVGRGHNPITFQPNSEKLQTVQEKNLKIKAVFLKFQM